MAKKNSFKSCIGIDLYFYALIIEFLFCLARPQNLGKDTR